MSQKSMSSATRRQRKAKKVAPDAHAGTQDSAANAGFDQAPKTQERLRALGLRIVSKRWRGWDSRYTFMCAAAGHRFVDLIGTVMQRRKEPCSRCCDEAWLQRVQEAAAAIGAQCLDSTWKGRQAKYRFRCDAGHRWTQEGLKDLRVSCARCTSEARRRRLLVQDGLQRFQKLAAARGGVCLSTTYEGVASRYLFRCAEGHEWKAFGNGVVRGHWCRRCHVAQMPGKHLKKEVLERLQRIARKRGGVCLSKRYKGIGWRYKFRCAEGHKWDAVGTAILGGRWCRLCANERRRRTIKEARRLNGRTRRTIEEARGLARERGGQCLSEAYPGSKTKMSWVCDRGHHWHTTFAVIRRGHWCPECAHEAKITRWQTAARRRYRTLRAGR